MNSFTWFDVDLELLWWSSRADWNLDGAENFWNLKYSKFGGIILHIFEGDFQCSLVLIALSNLALQYDDFNKPSENRYLSTFLLHASFTFFQCDNIFHRQTFDIWVVFIGFASLWLECQIIFLGVWIDISVKFF